MRIPIDAALLTNKERDRILNANHSGVYQIIITGDTKKEINFKIKCIKKLVKEMNK